ncbi:dihydroxyacetone kinase subunit L [Caballeronia sp. dw_19]|uniref:dihydroxyacetone kinase subunit L n=1 Tax=Caballeronia sp. dw_19 TaxID=2719791 RepID=UPI001BD5A3FD|nr:dihydroxyacetone kinase subunit L [Caballeronia sp. dw_19]
MPITVGATDHALRRWADAMDSAAPELNRLDGQLGDGDLGVTLVKSAAAVRTALDAGPYADLGQLFKACAMGCARASGSSFGTLLTLTFMTLAKRLEGCATLEWNALPAELQASLDAMSQRGGAKLGDKTVLDTLAAARDAIEGLSDPKAQHAAASAAVDAAIESFRTQPNRIGRARMFAQKSIGLDDPGMIAFRYMVASFSEG